MKYILVYLKYEYLVKQRIITSLLWEGLAGGV